MKHVIIGSGAAGIYAAKTIRGQRESDEIVIISTDEAVYSRCMLYKFIGNERSETELSFLPDDFFEKNNIRHLSGITVTGIDTSGKNVLFESGKESYDLLLIATGSIGGIPPISGLKGAKNVCTLDDLPDAKAIKAKAPGSKNIIIIGAGLVGLDAAHGLLKMGKKPVVVEMANFVLPENLDAHAASTYQSEFEKEGCVFRLGSRVSSVGVNAGGAVENITLNDTETLPCDLLIVAAGKIPNIGFLKNSKINITRAVPVDQYLRTNIPGIYAAGDVTGLSGNWPNAVLQGEIAGHNMCGHQTEYDETLSRKTTINFFGISSLSIGTVTSSEGDVIHIREDRTRYEKIVTRNGTPIGVLLQGNIARGGFWQHLVKNEVNISDISKPIWKISFADAYGLEPSGQYVWGR